MKSTIQKISHKIFSKTANFLSQRQENRKEPFLCVITPVFDEALPSLKALVESMQKQSLGEFIHVSISNGTSPKIKKFLKTLNQADKRFIYAQIPKQNIRNHQSLMVNLGKRRKYCLETYQAKRYLFLDADLKILDNDYFAKVFLADYFSHYDIIMTWFKHMGEIQKYPSGFDMNSFSFSKRLAKTHAYFTDMHPDFVTGNDYRYFKSIHTPFNTLVLPFVSGEKDGNRTYRRTTDRFFSEKVGSTMISLFGNSFIENDFAAIIKTLQSHLVGKGKIVEQFENSFKKIIGFHYAVATNSGTNAFWLLFRALRLKKSDEVLIPNIHFFGIRNVLEILRVRYSIIDVGKDLPVVTVESLKESLTKRTKAIIFLEYGGYPIEIQKIKRYLRAIGRSDILLVLDAANSPLTKIGPHYSAKEYDFALYSFDMNKILVTGDGGLILSNNQAIMDHIRSISYFGIKTGSGPSDLYRATHGKDRWWEIEVGDPSIMLSMNNLAASLGLTQLEQSDEILAVRRWIKRYYDKLLRPLVRQHMLKIPPKYIGVENNVYLYWIRLNDQSTRTRLAKYLLSKNIYTTLKYPLLLPTARTPNAQRFAQTALCLPLNQNLRETHVAYIVQSIQEFFWENA